MIKKTVTYKDLNGKERTETFYFHYFESEIMDMEMSEEGGLAERIQRIIDAKDQPSLLKVIKKFVIDAYGVKSDDGRRFDKSQTVKEAFVECPAFSKIYMELLTDDKAAAEFVNRVVPEDMKETLAAIAAKNSAAE
jgi:hypothetical protein